MALVIAEKTSQSDLGQQRTGNEDSFLEDAPLFAVADGMGGARAGEIASGMAVETLGTGFDPGTSPEKALVAVAKEANRRIWQKSQEDEELAGMGTTLSAVFFEDGEITIGHVGDSRVYRLREDELEQLTNDHSLVGELVRQGKLKPEEAETHPQRSIITRALGPESEVEVDTFTFATKNGDVYLVCSDGLTGMISDDDVAQILRRASSLDAAAQELIDAANANGGRDNITVILFRVAEVPDDGEGEEEGTLTGEPAVAGDLTKETPTRDTQVDTDIETTKESPMPDPDDLAANAVTKEREAMAEEEDEAPEDEGEPEEDAEGRRKEATLLLDAKSAGRARADASGGDAAPPTRRRRRRVVVATIAILVVAALIAGIYAGSRQFFFIGTNDDGLLTVYKGIPYDLPLGIELYEQEYTSTVPALSLRKRHREVVLDHQLRDRGDAVDLVRELERARTS